MPNAFVIDNGFNSLSSSTITGSLSVTGGITGSLLGTSSWATNAISSSYSINSTSASYSLNSTSASYVNTLNQNVIITGSLTVGSGSVGSGENTLIVGPAPNAGSGEGGQILLSAAGGTYSSASMLDNYQNKFRILRGTNAGNDGFKLQIDLQTGQVQIPNYNSSTAFTGTSVANLAVDSSGNILTVAAGGGGGGATNQITSGSATASISPTTGFIVNTNSLISGSLFVTGSITGSAALFSGSGVQRLIVIGSGSSAPLFKVQGSQGELFSVTDSLSGSLFSVNDISGLPILEVFSDNTTLMGSYTAPALYTTNKILSSIVGANLIYSLATASYDGVFIDYTIKSGSNARAGNFIAIWSGSSVNYTDNSTTDFGSTTGFTFAANIAAGNMVISGSGTTAGWTIKTLIKAI